MTSIDLKITGEIAALKLSPGDVVVVNLKGKPPTSAEAEHLADQLGAFFPGHRILVLPEDVSITTTREEPRPVPMLSEGVVDLILDESRPDAGPEGAFG